MHGFVVEQHWQCSRFSRAWFHGTVRIIFSNNIGNTRLFPGMISSYGGVSRYFGALLKSIGSIRGNRGMISTCGVSRYGMVLLNIIGNNSRFPVIVSTRGVSRLAPGFGYQLRHNGHFSVKFWLRLNCGPLRGCVFI